MPNHHELFDLAHEGAQIRAIASAVREGQLQLSTSPRSIIVVAPDHFYRCVVRAGLALLPDVSVPVVCHAELPRYAGAMDVVIITGDDRHEPQAYAAASTAHARGCVCTLISPYASYTAEETGVTGLPALPAVAQNSPARTIAVLAACVLGLRMAPAGVAEILDCVADEVDEELAACHPEREAVVNPARALAEYVHTTPVVHVAAKEGTEEFTALIAALFNRAGGQHSALSAQDYHLHAEAAPSTGEDIFYDPFLDEPPVMLTSKVVVWALGPTAELVMPVEARCESCDTHSADTAGALPLGGAHEGATEALAPGLRLIARAWAASCATG
ncbi:hypothetical protein CCICO_09010 [Corynebacterium ciconiae DSM 44920]|uniref:hypothetical protein n=1 Tax=Corynebacterium ciconiae TaxID=227319 RepID=UPI0003782F2E|nr:hypothetical protein [Corynebacterium ciconiae]WKD61810.1 hypothetical protein CCICO_09010 [Corynebacterium ciconiae DSM 44920]